MIHVIIALMNGWATFFLLLAIVWGLYNYTHEMPVTNFWITYTAAAGAGALFTAARAVEWAGITGPYIDQLQAFFAIIAATILATTALVCAVSPVERQVK